MKVTIKRVLLIAMVAVFVLAFVACNATTTTTESSEAASVATTEASTEAVETSAESATSTEVDVSLLTESQKETYDKLMYKPVVNTTGRELKAAVICLSTTNFWIDLLEGTDDVKDLLSNEQFNVSIDLIEIPEWDDIAFSDAIEDCITLGYDVISTIGAGDGEINAINDAVDAGIVVNTFNTDTASESKKTAFVGQDLYAAGYKCGELLAEYIDYKGQVGIIPQLFSTTSSELRRTGCVDALSQYPDIEIVAQVEGQDSVDEVYARAMDMITGYPDLKGIYNVFGGYLGLINAVKETGNQGKIAVVVHDLTDEVLEAIYDGTINASVGQDPWTQGALPTVLGYNQIVNGTPDVTGNVCTDLDVVTKDNIDEYYTPAG